MRRFFTIIMMAALPWIGQQAWAQTLLDEDFETASTETYSQPVADGWTTVNSYTGSKKNYV